MPRYKQKRKSLHDVKAQGASEMFAHSRGREKCLWNADDTFGAFLLFLYKNCVPKMLTPGIKN